MRSNNGLFLKLFIQLILFCLISFVCETTMNWLFNNAYVMYSNRLYTFVSLSLYLFFLGFVSLLLFSNANVVGFLQKLQHRYVEFTVYLYIFIPLTSLICGILLMSLYSLLHTYELYWACSYMCLSNCFLVVGVFVHELIHGPINNKWCNSLDLDKSKEQDLSNKYKSMSPVVFSVTKEFAVAAVGVCFAVVVVGQTMSNPFVTFLNTVAKNAGENFSSYVGLRSSSVSEMHRNEAETRLIEENMEFTRLNNLLDLRQRLLSIQSAEPQSLTMAPTGTSEQANPALLALEGAPQQVNPDLLALDVATRELSAAVSLHIGSVSRRISQTASLRTFSNTVDFSQQASEVLPPTAESMRQTSDFSQQMGGVFDFSA
jgi:hypothetical protein